MRIILADLRGRDGVVTKDTVAGGYGSRLRPFSRVTTAIGLLKRRLHDTWLILAGRFLPGLRSTIAASAAAAAIRPIWFTCLNMVSSILWAGTVMLVVIHGGGWWERWAGVPRPVALAIPAVLVVGFFYVLGRLSRPGDIVTDGGGRPVS